MTLIEIYSLLQTKEITEEDAAKALDLTITSFRSRCTKLGHRLPLVFSVLDKIRADKITRDEAAAALGVSVRQVNKLSESWAVKRPMKEYVINRTASKVKCEIRKKYAIDFIAGGMEIKDAAERAEVSDRQMRRWVSELLNKHFQIVWKDLNHIALNRRRRMAEEIENAEGLELAKQNVINSISRGDKSLEEEAIERVVARRARLQGTTPVRRTTDNTKGP